MLCKALVAMLEGNLLACVKSNISKISIVCLELVQENESTQYPYNPLPRTSLISSAVLLDDNRVTVMYDRFSETKQIRTQLFDLFLASLGKITSQANRTSFSFATRCLPVELHPA